MSLDFWSINNFGQEQLNIHGKSKCNVCYCVGLCFCFCNDFCVKYMPKK